MWERRGESPRAVLVAALVAWLGGFAGTAGAQSSDALDAGMPESDSAADAGAPPSEPVTEPPSLEVAEDPATTEETVEVAPEGDDEPLRVGDLEITGAVEDLSLDELLGVVVSATRTQLRTAEAPSSVHVITYRDIRRRGYRTVADALRHVPGLHVIDDLVTQSVGVRGVHATPNSANDTLRVMINGQPVSFRPTNVAFLAEDLIPIEAVERIEVLRGPASALYGANAFLGVVNVITFDGSDDERTSGLPAHSVTVEGYVLQNPRETPFGGRVAVFSSGSEGPVRYMVSGTVHYGDRSGLVVPGIEDLVRDDPWRSDPTRFPAPQGRPSPGWDLFARSYLLRNAVSRNDTDLSASLYALGVWDLTDDVSARLDGHLQYSERSAEWQSFTYLTHDSRLTHLTGFARLTIDVNEGVTSGPSLRASVAISGGRPLDHERIVDRLVDSSYRRRRFGSLALDATVTGQWAFGPRDSISLGADYTHDIEDLLSTETVSGTSVSASRDFPDTSFQNVGVFAQWMWAPIEDLTLTLGARADWNSEIACNSREWDCLGEREDVTRPSSLSDDQVLIDGRGWFQLSSRAALFYQLPWEGLYAKLTYGSSYKPPSPYQLYHGPITSEGADVGNPSIQPQTSDTVELTLGIERSEGLTASIVGYYTAIENLVVYVNDAPVLTSRNAFGEFSGIEAEVRYESGDVLSFWGSFDWLFYSRLSPQRERGETDFAWQSSPLNATTGAERFPEWTARAGADLRFEEQHLDVNLAVIVVGPRNASISNNQLYDPSSLSSTYTLDPYLLADLTISTIGVRLLPERETVFTLSIRGAPGAYVETGVSGLDIPSVGTRIMLRAQQQL